MRAVVINRGNTLDDVDAGIGAAYAGMMRLARGLLPAIEQQELGSVVETCEQVTRLAMRASALDAARRIVAAQPIERL